MTLRTDHSALLYLRRSPELIGQQARWLDFLENFDLELEHRSGSRQANADSLSRRPCARTGPCKQCKTGPLERPNVGNSEEMNANIDADATLLRAVNTRSRRKCEQSKQNETGVEGDLEPGRYSAGSAAHAA